MKPSKAMEVVRALDRLRVKRRDPMEENIENGMLISKINSLIEAGRDIVFVLPSFPFKSKNQVRKVLGKLPDKGQELAVVSLSELELDLAKISLPVKIRFALALDGFTYADILGVDGKDVRAYSSAVVRLFRKDPTIIEWFDFFTNDSDSDAFVSMLEEKYCQTTDEVRRLIETQDAVRVQYSALARFWIDDVSDGSLSSRSAERLGKQIAVKIMSRNKGYSKYLEDAFPDSIRLSVHQSTLGSMRFHVNLIPENTFGGTPWHNVALKTAIGWRLIKHQLAKEKGHTLRYQDNLPSYFEEGES